MDRCIHEMVPGTCATCLHGPRRRGHSNHGLTNDARSHQDASTVRHGLPWTAEELQTARLPRSLRSLAQELGRTVNAVEAARRRAS